ncbi:helix-turn-helix protein [Bosea sp. BK604]|nr:helix-turn-helix protein [Bosea sp. BK604]
MKFFRFDIGARSIAASRFIGGVRGELLKALVERKDGGLTQQALAQKLGMSRTELNRQLSGSAPLSLRVISGMAWALDREIVFELRPKSDRPGQNQFSDTATLETDTRTIGEASSSSTLPSRPAMRIRSPASAK